MVEKLDRPGSKYQKASSRLAKPIGALAALGLLALAACAEPVPPPIVPPPIYSQEPYPAPVYQPYYGGPYYYYARPYPYYSYGPCCSSFSFSYRSGGGYYRDRHWHH